MTSRAFGLDLAGDVELPGTAAPGAPEGSPLVLRRVIRAELVADWRVPRTHVAAARANGRMYARVVRNPRGDLLFRAQGMGLIELRGDLTLVRYAPIARPLVPWTRYLVAQVLPFAALLAGFEVLHAGAVELGGEAVAVTAPSTGGKSTLLAALLQAGRPLVADDVVAVRRNGDRLTVHPGPALLSLREGSTPLLGGPAALAALGPEVADVPGSTWREVRRHAEPLPMRALVVLERRADATRVELVREARPDPRGLLGTTFNAAWQERGRMTRLLDVISLLSARVPVYVLRAPVETSPARLAEDVLRSLA